MHAYYLRLKRGLSGCTLVMYWDTVYTRSTHGLRVTLVRITPEEPPLTQTHSLDSLPGPREPRRSRAQAARQQPRPVVDLRRPVVDLRRPVHAPPVFIGMNMGANSWSMNASVCVTTSTPPHTLQPRGSRESRGSRASRPQRRRTHLRGHTRVCIRSAQLQQLTTQGNYHADIIIRASSRA
jgi:hypothetical protein